MNTQSQLAAVTAEPYFKHSLSVGFAQSFTEIREAQRLRYDVFAREMGARLHTCVPGLDYDYFDAHCQHLLVRDPATGQVVGCTRLLTGRRARRAGGFYAEKTFDLGAVLTTSGRLLEISRTCIHPDYRNKATIIALWSGLASFVNEYGFDHLIDCVSIPLGRGGEIQAIVADLAQHYMAPIHLRVRPLIPVPRQDVLAGDSYILPPLLKAYLRAGAWICGEPCLNADFKGMDLFILLPIEPLGHRYLRVSRARYSKLRPATRQVLSAEGVWCRYDSR